MNMCERVRAQAKQTPSLKRVPPNQRMMAPNMAETMVKPKNLYGKFDEERAPEELFSSSTATLLEGQ